MSSFNNRQALTTATSIRLFALLVLVALGGVLGALPAAAQTPALSKTSFTYQGQLLNAGSRLNATCSFQFTLYDAATEGNIVGATQTVDNVTVQDSYFTAQLDFGETPFGDAVRYLALAVKCPPEETFTAMEGRLALTAAPAALVAQKALAAPWSGITGIPTNLTSFSSLACTNGQVAKWNSTKTTWECAVDNDLDTDTDTLASLTCSDGQIAKWNAASKVWECKADNDTTYDVYTKSNLQTTGEAQVHWGNLTNVPSNLTFLNSPTPCTNGQIAKWNSTKTTWECAVDNDLDTDTLASLTCSDGQIAKWNAASKVWECKADNDTTYDLYTKTNLQTTGEAQVHWGNLTNVPTNTKFLNNPTACASGQVAKWNGSSWFCGDIEIGTDTLASLACTNGQIAKWNGIAWACTADNDTTYDLYTKTNLQTTGQAQVHWGNLTNVPTNLTFLNNPTACTSGQVAKWNGTAWACAADVDTDTNTTYTAGSGLGLTGTTFGINFAGNGSVTTAARSDHTHTLTAVDGVPIGATTAAAGKFTTLEAPSLKVTGGTPAVGKFLGSDASGNATWQTIASTWGGLTGVPANLTNFSSLACTSGQVAKWNGTAWACAADVDTDTNTTYTAGSGLGLTGTTFSLASVENVPIGATTPSTGKFTTLAVTGGTPAVGKVLTSDASGTATWQTLASSGWGLTGNAGTTPGTNFIGTTDAQALEFKVNNIRVLRLEAPNGANPNVIGGYSGNTVTSGSATIGGGGGPETGVNTVTANYGTVGGGTRNTASGYAATVGGGYHNTASGESATVNGGGGNTASGTGATVGGGDTNTASGTYYATVGGGNNNTAINSYATVGGGRNNTASDMFATVGGGSSNTANGNNATVGGGYANTASGTYATVSGGLGAEASLYGQMAYASGTFAAASVGGAAQTSVYVLRNTTTNATQTELYLDEGSNTAPYQRLTIASGRAYAFSVQVVGTTIGGALAGMYEIKGGIKNAGGTVSFVGTPTVTILGESVAGWDAAVAADDTNDALAIKVTGAVSTNIRWVATVRTTEVGY